MIMNLCKNNNASSDLTGPNGFDENSHGYDSIEQTFSDILF